MDVRGIGEQAVLDRERQQLADGRGVHLRQLQAREEHALGGQHRLDLFGARHLVERPAVLAAQLAARVEQHPGLALAGLRTLARGQEDAQLHVQ
jgi:hypothetical protein